jgi:hypothetical protein
MDICWNEPKESIGIALHEELDGIDLRGVLAIDPTPSRVTLASDPVDKGPAQPTIFVEEVNLRGRGKREAAALRCVVIRADEVRKERHDH